MSLRFSLLFCLLLPWSPVSIHGAAASSPDRIAPPPGITIADTNRNELETSALDLLRQITRLREELRGRSQLENLLPDVEIFHKAVHWALVHHEFFRSNDIALARQLLKAGLARANDLHSGRAPWLTATGLVVRGFVSRIDGSVQPYGLVVPADFAGSRDQPRRLDVWLHGRDNHLTELKFISDRLKSAGDFTPDGTFVLHPYGRYCNAFKFAGETDVFEALEHAKRSYPIDGSRVSVRGFSMGGAGTWHLAAHHGGFWAAAAPGAGFAETADYTKALAKEPKPSWFEQTLWHLYDATDYAANFAHCPVIAYSGELDKQKQAADTMARAFKAEGLELTHLIGPGVEHKYEPATKRELARRFDALLANSADAWPGCVHLTTWTLRYNRNKWVTVDALERHWKRADADARIDGGRLHVTTTNVAQLTLAIPPLLAGSPDLLRTVEIDVDGQTLVLRPPETEPWTATLSKNGSKWSADRRASIPALSKRHGLQGPIDDAFMDSFIMVRPTGQPMNRTLGRWTAAELARATNEWRAQFRGDARVKNDVEISDANIAAHHLVLWGDPKSNRLLARIAARLPLRWDEEQFSFGKKQFSSDECVPVLIFPNPLNPSRYVVINSGFTFWREGAASNARQTPKLPDFAALEMNGTGRSEDRILHAGFFGEHWEMPPP
jgi:dienelactone hydrolase